MKIIQALERERSRQISVSARPAWSTLKVQGSQGFTEKSCLKVTKGNAEDGSLVIVLTTQSIIMSVKRSRVWILSKSTPYILPRFDSPTIIPTLERDKITGASQLTRSPKSELWINPAQTNEVKEESRMNPNMLMTSMPTLT